MREPVFIPHITAYYHVTWRASFVSLCASGFSSVKWARELNWLLASLSRTLRTDTLTSLEDKMLPCIRFGTNLPCKYVLCIVYSGTVWHRKSFNENRSCLHALMSTCNFMCITSLLMFYKFWIWLCPVSKCGGNCPSDRLHVCTVPGQEVGRLNFCGRQSCRIVQRSYCAGGLGVYSRSSLCRAEGLTSLGTDKQPSISSCCPAFWRMGWSQLELSVFTYRAWWRRRIPPWHLGDMGCSLCAASTLVLTFTCCECVLSLINVPGGEEGCSCVEFCNGEVYMKLPMTIYMKTV